MKFTIILFLVMLIALNGNSQTENATYYLEKAHKQIDKEKYEDALNTLDMAIKKMPDSALLYDTRGTLLEAFRMYEDAINDFTKGIENTNDDELKAHFLANRGASKARIRDFKGSYEDLNLAIELDPANIDALNNLAAVCDEVNEPEEALEYLNEIIRLDPTYVPGYINLGFKYQGLNNHEKAIENFDKAIELAPKEPLGYSNRAFSKLKTNDLKGALKDINHSLKLYPTNSYAFKIRALIYIEKKDMEDACVDLSEAESLGYKAQFGDEVEELKMEYCN